MKLNYARSIFKYTVSHQDNNCDIPRNNGDIQIQFLYDA